MCWAKYRTGNSLRDLSRFGNVWKGNSKGVYFQLCNKGFLFSEIHLCTVSDHSVIIKLTLGNFCLKWLMHNPTLIKMKKINNKRIIQWVSKSHWVTDSTTETTPLTVWRDRQSVISDFHWSFDFRWHFFPQKWKTNRKKIQWNVHFLIIKPSYGHVPDNIIHDLQ